MNHDMMNQTQNNPYSSTQGDMMQTAQPDTRNMPMRQFSSPVAPSLPFSATPSLILTQQQQDNTMTRNGPPPVMDVDYIPGFLAKNIGRFVKAEFVVGTNQFVDRTGRLMAVGVNYFTLQDLVTNAIVMCDLYSVKFVTLL